MPQAASNVTKRRLLLLGDVARRLPRRPETLVQDLPDALKRLKHHQERLFALGDVAERHLDGSGAPSKSYAFLQDA